MRSTLKDGELVQIVPLGEILDPPRQLRLEISSERLYELERSIAKYGLLNPIHLRNKDGKYEIIAGHRRFLATRNLGHPGIKAFIINTDDRSSLLLSIQENLQRTDLTPIEEAIQVNALYNDGEIGIDEIAKILNRSIDWVDNRLQLLHFDEKLIEAIHAGKISMGAARELDAVKDPAHRDYLLTHALNSGVTERQARSWRQDWQLHRDIQTGVMSPDQPHYEPLPPMPVTVKCFFCGDKQDIVEIEYLRFCKACVQIILDHRPPEEKEG